MRKCATQQVLSRHADVGFIIIRTILLNPANLSSSSVDPEQKALQIVCLQLSLLVPEAEWFLILS